MDRSRRSRRLTRSWPAVAVFVWAVFFMAMACEPHKSALRETGQLANIAPPSLERPIALAEGATTASPSRAFVEQGRVYLASFDWLRAARSFHQALRENEHLATAHLGLARAFLGLESVDRAEHHARTAAALAARYGSDPREADWIALGVLQMEAVVAARGDGETHHQSYLRAIERYLDRYPGDVKAWVLRGNADPRPDGWGQAGGEGSLSWYRRALELEPSWFPAEHFLAHSLENLGRYDEAIGHARRYAALAPAAPHAHHMVAHVSPRLGAWDEALESLAMADRLHRLSFESGELEPEEDWHYGHNLRLMAAVHLGLGDHQKAGDLYQACFEIPYSGRRAGFYCQPWVTFLLLEGRAEEALAAAQRCGRRDSDLAGVLGSALEGEALVALGRGDEARQALEAARRWQQRLGAGLRSDRSERTVAVAARLAVWTLEAKLELETDAARGVESIRRVVAAAGGGHSFDAWASGSLRVAEITAHLRRHGHPRLADEIVVADLAGVMEAGGVGQHCS